MSIEIGGSSGSSSGTTPRTPSPFPPGVLITYTIDVTGRQPHAEPVITFRPDKDNRVDQNQFTSTFIHIDGLPPVGKKLFFRLPEDRDDGKAWQGL